MSGTLFIEARVIPLMTHDDTCTTKKYKSNGKKIIWFTPPAATSNFLFRWDLRLHFNSAGFFPNLWRIVHLTVYVTFRKIPRSSWADQFSGLPRYWHNFFVFVFEELIFFLFLWTAQLICLKKGGCVTHWEHHNDSFFCHTHFVLLVLAAASSETYRAKLECSLIINSRLCQLSLTAAVHSYTDRKKCRFAKRCFCVFSKKRGERDAVS